MGTSLFEKKSVFYQQLKIVDENSQQSQLQNILEQPNENNILSLSKNSQEQEDENNNKQENKQNIDLKIDSDNKKIISIRTKSYSDYEKVTKDQNQSQTINLRNSKEIINRNSSLGVQTQQNAINLLNENENENEKTQSNQINSETIENDIKINNFNNLIDDDPETPVQINTLYNLKQQIRSSQPKQQRNSSPLILSERVRRRESTRLLRNITPISRQGSSDNASETFSLKILQKKHNLDLREIKNKLEKYDELQNEEKFHLCLTGFLSRIEKRHHYYQQIIERYIQNLLYVKKYTKYEKNFARIISNLSKYEYCPKGKCVFFAGERADSFYVILKGQAGVVLVDKVDEDGILEIIQKKYPKYANVLTDPSKKSFQNTFLHVLSRDKVFENEGVNMIWNNLYEPEMFIDKKFMLFKALESGECFGEMGILNQAPRSATIIALTDCHLMKLSKKSYEQAIKVIEEIRMMKKVNFFYSSLKFDFSHREFCRIILDFNNKEQFIIKQLETKVKILNQFRKFHYNTNIIKEGDKSNKIYIILKGQVLITKKLVISQCTSINSSRQKQNEMEQSYKYMKQLIKQTRNNEIKQNFNKTDEHSEIELQICTLGVGEFLGLDNFLQQYNQQSTNQERGNFNYTVKCKTSVKVYCTTFPILKRLIHQLPKLGQLLKKRNNIFMSSQKESIMRAKDARFKVKFNKTPFNKEEQIFNENNLVSKMGQQLANEKQQQQCKQEKRKSSMMNRQSLQQITMVPQNIINVEENNEKVKGKTEIHSQIHPLLQQVVWDKEKQIYGNKYNLVNQAKIMEKKVSQHENVFQKKFKLKLSQEKYSELAQQKIFEEKDMFAPYFRKVMDMKQKKDTQDYISNEKKKYDVQNVFSQQNSSNNNDGTESNFTKLLKKNIQSNAHHHNESLFDPAKDLNLNVMLQQNDKIQNQQNSGALSQRSLSVLKLKNSKQKSISLHQTNCKSKDGSPSNYLLKNNKRSIQNNQTKSLQKLNFITKPFNQQEQHFLQNHLSRNLEQNLENNKANILNNSPKINISLINNENCINNYNQFNCRTPIGSAQIRAKKTSSLHSSSHSSRFRSTPRSTARPSVVSNTSQNSNYQKKFGFQNQVVNASYLTSLSHNRKRDSLSLFNYEDYDQEGEGEAKSQGKLVNLDKSKDGDWDSIIEKLTYDIHQFQKKLDHPSSEVKQQEEKQNEINLQLINKGMSEINLDQLLQQSTRSKSGKDNKVISNADKKTLLEKYRELNKYIQIQENNNSSKNLIIKTSNINKFSLKKKNSNNDNDNLSQYINKNKKQNQRYEQALQSIAIRNKSKSYV